MSENLVHRFYSVLGATTVVCGMHLFLFATSNWDSTTEVEPVTPAVEVSVRSNLAGPVAELEIATPSVSVEAATKHQLAGSNFAGQMALESSVKQLGVFSETPRFTASTEEQVQVALEERPPITTEGRVGDPPLPAAASANISVTLEEQPHITGEARAGDQTPPVSAIGILQEQPLMTAEARVGNQTEHASAIGSISVALTEQPHVTAEALVRGKRLLLSASANVSAESATKPQAPELVDNSSVVQETIRYIPDATEPQDSKQGEDNIQTAPIAAAVPNTNQSSVKVSPRKGIHERSLAQGSNPKRAPKLAMTTQREQASQVAPREKKIVSARVNLSPSLTETQPKRRDTINALKEKPSSKLAAKSNLRQTESSQVSSRWKPMALAPADKPSLSLTQSQPKTPDARGYNAKIWSALSRKKPNAGQRGSTTVTFGIGAAGVLQFVRVSHSSGNVRLDQLALATVRNAAPFPPPPAPQAATYAIRIDFH